MDAKAKSSHEARPRHASVSDVRQDLAALKSDAADCAVGVAEAGMEAIRSGAETLRETAHTARDTARKAHESLNESISHRPTTSVLLAFALGAVIGRVFARR